MKRNYKSLLKNIIPLCIGLLLASCGINKNNSTNNSNGTNNISQDYVVESGQSSINNSGQNEIEDNSVTFSSIKEATAALVNSLTEDQKNETLPEEYESNVYEISAAGNYYFTGSLDSAITVAKNSGDVHIYLDNVTLSVDSSNAMSFKKGANVTITLIGNSNVSNTGTAKHVIDSKENLVINGSGSLTVNSTKSAIACDKTFIGLDGKIDVNANNHCVTADSIYIDEMEINAISCGKDILHAESDYDEVESAPEFSYGAGFVFIENGAINSTNVLGDGIQADSFVYIKDGTYNIKTTPTWNDNYVATENQEKGMYNVSSHQKVSRDSVRKGSTYAILEESVKAIKVGEIDYYLASDLENELTVSSDNYSILIEGGTFNLNMVDDAIHANSGSISISGGNFTINTSDDGIHADNNLKITGDSVIDIQTSYEGIEAQTIDISGGNTTINALDDGVNATNSNLTENQQKQVCQINVSGGRLDVTVNPGGDRDGIDSNGGIKITGGTVITRGPNSEMASPMDAANNVSITGGNVIIIGCAPGAGGRFSGPGGRSMGQNEGSFSSTLTKTQSSSKGLSKGNHTITIDDVTISYTNAYSYSGYTTVYANGNVTIN